MKLLIQWSLFSAHSNILYIHAERRDNIKENSHFIYHLKCVVITEEITCIL